MQCFISIMCTYNAQPIITLLLLCFSLWIHMNLYEKNLLFRSHPRSPVYAAAVSLVLIWYMMTMCRPKPCPSPSLPPICLKSLARDIKRTVEGRGRSRCWSSPVSSAPTEFSHGADPSYMAGATVISDGSPFFRENTPVGTPEPEMSPPP